MKVLPKLYKNENAIKDNNKRDCLVKEEKIDSTINDNKEKELNNIFNNKGFPFDKKVLIKTTDKIYKTYLVTRTENTVVTLNDEIINIDDIISIERI